MARVPSDDQVKATSNGVGWDRRRIVLEVQAIIDMVLADWPAVCDFI